jgi:hypothetical protein
MSNSVERTIHFFAASPKRQDRSLSHIDLGSALKAVEALPFSNEGRYLELGDGNTLCMWPERARGLPPAARLARIRKRDLPQVEDKGVLSALDIPRSSGLAEQIHFMVFENGIVGCEFNFYGPRPVRVAEYLTTKAPAGGDFYLAPLLRKDVTDQLTALVEIRTLHIKTKASYSGTLKKMDEDLGTALETLAQRGHADVIEVVLRAGRSRKKPALKRNLLAFARKVSDRDDARTEMARFVVRGESGETGRVEEVDVLSDFLIAKKWIATVDDKTRAVSSPSAYAAIYEAYRELKGELHDAAGLKP